MFDKNTFTANTQLKISPFFDITSKINESQEWKRWGGYLSATKYELNHENEYFSIRTKAGLLDISPLYKYIIEADRLERRYSMGAETIYAIKDISFNIVSGEYVAIMGPSGSGKSTLIRTFNGLESFDKGELSVLGIKIDSTCDEREIKKIRKRVGMVFQQFN